MNEEEIENKPIDSQTQNSTQNKNNNQKSKRGYSIFVIICLLLVCLVPILIVYHYDKELVITEVVSELVVLIFSGKFYTKFNKKNKNEKNWFYIELKSAIFFQ